MCWSCKCHPLCFLLCETGWAVGKLTTSFLLLNSSHSCMHVLRLACDSRAFSIPFRLLILISSLPLLFPLQFTFCAAHFPAVWRPMRRKRTRTVPVSQPVDSALRQLPRWVIFCCTVIKNVNFRVKQNIYCIKKIGLDLIIFPTSGQRLLA